MVTRGRAILLGCRLELGAETRSFELAQSYASKRNADIIPEQARRAKSANRDQWRRRSLRFKLP